MAEWSKFTDSEILLIKQKVNESFKKGMIVISLLATILCLPMPYFPLKRHGSMIDRMPYWDAVIQCTIYWALALIGVWIWNYFNSQKEFTNNRKFLRKKNAVVQIIDKSRGRFSLFENEITTNVEGGLRFLKVDKEQSQNFMIGDHLEIEYEEHTKTIFKMTKAKNIQD